MFVAKFVGVKNLLEGKIVGENGHYVFEGGIRIKLNGNYECGNIVLGIRPEDILIISSSNCRFRGENVFVARVLDIYPLTLSTVRVLLNVNGTKLVVKTIKSKAIRMGLRRGSEI